MKQGDDIPICKYVISNKKIDIGKGGILIAFVDNGIIVRSDSTWLYVKPRCPHCGYMRQTSGYVGPGEYEVVGKPASEFATHSIGTSCPKCGQRFRITSFYG